MDEPDTAIEAYERTEVGTAGLMRCPGPASDVYRAFQSEVEALRGAGQLARPAL